MTEAEWLTAADPVPLLEFLRGKATDRKLRLCTIAALRWGVEPDRKLRLSYEVVERFADDSLPVEEVRRQWGRQPNTWPERPAEWLEAVVTGEQGADPPIVSGSEMSGLIRDVFGHSFHPVGLDPAWRTEAVVGLATGIYADRAFDRLPVLADALEDAGCADADVLTHCRGPGPHVRGCWVVDLLLGKA